MARADSGGFDLVLEVDMAGVQERVAEAVAKVAPDGWTTDVPGLQLGFHPYLKIEGTFSGFTLEPGPKIVSTSTLSVTISWGGFGDPSDRVDAGSSTRSIVVTTRCTPKIENGGLWVTDMTVVEVSVDKEEWTKVAGILGYRGELTDPSGVLTTFFWDSLRARLLDALKRAIPSGLLIGILPVGSAQLDSVGQELRVLITVDGQPGTPEAITRSAIRPAPAGAKPRDLAAVIVGNDYLLRTIVRPALEAGFTLTGKGTFVGPHPCYWVGGTIPGGQLRLGTLQDTEVLIDRVMAEIDTDGALRTCVYFSGRHTSGGFGFTGSASHAITPSVEPDGKRVKVTVKSPQIDHLDIWLEWWVYALMTLGFGSIGLLVTGLLDAFLGGTLKRGVFELLPPLLDGGFEKLDVPCFVCANGPVRPELQPQGQPDAEWQTVCLPQCVPVSRANDVVFRVRG